MTLAEARQTEMPFGKFAEQELAKIDTGYLVFALENFTIRQFELREAIKLVLVDRIQSLFVSSSDLFADTKHTANR